MNANGIYSLCVGTTHASAAFVLGSRKKIPVFPSALIVSPGANVRCSGIGAIPGAAVGVTAAVTAAVGDAATGVAVPSDFDDPPHPAITAHPSANATAPPRIPMAEMIATRAPARNPTPSRRFPYGRRRPDH